MLFSIERRAEVVVATILGLKIKLTRAKGLEHEHGGPYGMYALVKQRAALPFCTASVISQHGWTTLDALPTDLANARTLMLCWNARHLAGWRAKSAVPCLVLGAPFVHYRRARGIGLDPAAKGTVAFPAHSLQNIEYAFNLDEYCAALKALPEEFQPVTVCLHPTDILCFGRDREYRARGFETVCAGLKRHDADQLPSMPHDHPSFRAACAGFNTTQPFCEAFYDILRRHRYATSNVPGSYLFYAVEMGQPFFLLGALPASDNSAGVNPDVPAQVNRVNDLALGQQACDLFTVPPGSPITAEQRAFVLEEIGADAWAEPEELAQALRRATVDEHLAKGRLAFGLTMLKRLLRHPLHAGETLAFFRFVRESARLLGRG